MRRSSAMSARHFDCAQTLCRNNQQQRDDETHEDAGDRVPEYERSEIRADQKRNTQHCVDQHKRLADEIQQVELSTFPTASRMFRPINVDQLKRDRDGGDVDQLGRIKTKPIGSQ